MRISIIFNDAYNLPSFCFVLFPPESWIPVEGSLTFKSLQHAGNTVEEELHLEQLAKGSQCGMAHECVGKSS